MTTPTLPRRRGAALALGAALLLTGCGGGADAGGDIKSPASSSPSATTPELAIPDSCTQVDREAGSTVDGSALGPCLEDAAREAGSGKRVIEFPGKSPKVVTAFKSDPKYMEYATRDGVPDYLISGDTGYVYIDDHWVKADPASTDPEIKSASGVVKLLQRQPLTAGLSSSAEACPQWVSMGKTDLQEDGAESEGYQYRCTESIEKMGATIDELNIWLDDDYRLIQQSAGGTYNGTDVPTSVVNYSGWGEPVDMPDPEDLK